MDDSKSCSQLIITVTISEKKKKNPKDLVSYTSWLELTVTFNYAVSVSQITSPRLSSTLHRHITPEAPFDMWYRVFR